ncbi:MAG: hypothetical protein ACM3QS_09790 [Bacteroidota bacterium]
MHSIRQGIGIVLAALFVLTALPAQILFNIDRQAFNAQTYQRALADQSFYQQLPSILGTSISSSIGAHKLPAAMQGLSSQDWERFMSDLLPPPILQEMGDEAVDSTLAYLNKQSDHAQVSMKPLKERLMGEPGKQAVLNLLRKQPVCTLEEIARISVALLNQQQISLCNPPEELYPILLPVIQGQMQVVSALIPDQVTLLQAESAPGRADPRDQLRLVRLGMRLFPLVPLFFLTLLTIAAVRSLRGWLGWWGISLFVTGVAGSLAAWLGAPLLGYVLLQVLNITFARYLPSVLLQSSSQLAAGVADQLMRPVLIQGLVLLFAGGLMLALAAVARRSEAPV